MPREYLELIQESIEAVTQPYFHLATTYEPDGIVRERVFCYELYHQIRSRMKANHLLSLNGEIDKRGHPDFRDGDQKNPDFVFHIPGTHEGNTIIVEVKGKMQDPSPIIKDFKTLLTFISRYRYQAGVFILYNYSRKDLLDHFRKQIIKLAEDHAAQSVYIFTIAAAHQACEKFTLSSVLESRQK